MFHTVSGAIVSGEMKHECIGIKLRRPPHLDLGTDNPFEITHKTWPPPAFLATRMDDDAVGLFFDVEFVQRPIRTDLRWIVDHDLVVGIPPLQLIRLLRTAVNYFPVEG